MRSPEDVIPHLGKPTHWKTGRSAKELAESWYHAKGFPGPVGALLSQSDVFAGAEFLDGWLERETDLGDCRGTPSQTDMLGLIGTAAGLAVLGIEAKVDESFGPVERFNGVDLWVGWAADSVWNSFFDQPGASDFPGREQPIGNEAVSK